MKPNNLITFDKDSLFKELGQFKVSQNPIDRKVRTWMGKEKISEYQPGTKHYQVVDFGSMGKEFITQIGSKMNITKSNLSIAGGIQELRLFGDDFTIGKDTYTQQATLLSSTNGLRKFAVFAGIFRYICSNGAYSALGESVVYSARHYKSNEHILKAMEFEFGSLDNAFNGTKIQIEKLLNKKVKLTTLKKGLVEKDGDNAQKFLAFVQKLLVSKTDRLDGKDITAQQLKRLELLKTPKDLLKINPANDMTLDAYKAFQCYTELFRAQSADIIQKETDKVLIAIGA